MDQTQYNNNSQVLNGASKKKRRYERKKNKRIRIQYEEQCPESIPLPPPPPPPPPIQIPKIETDFEKVLSKCLKIFPYEKPYPSQVESMKRIIQSLVDKTNLLFQSPTGTGKTLISICCALAYKTEINNNIQIIFLTRTNEQVDGFIKEIRKISKEYSPKYAVAVGRNSLCLKTSEIQEQQNGNEYQQKIKFSKQIQKYCEKNTMPLNPELIEERKFVLPTPSFHCLNKQNKVLIERQNVNPDEMKQKYPFSDCIHNRITEAYFSESKDWERYQYPNVMFNEQEPRLPDIEDMKLLFDQENLGCPYFFNQKIMKSADIIFTNYNYLIKQSILDLFQYRLKDNVIVIFDEAHNITEQAEQELRIRYKFGFFTILKDTFQLFFKLFPKNNQKYTNRVQSSIMEKFTTYLECCVDLECNQLRKTFVKQFGEKDKLMNDEEAARQKELKQPKQDDSKFRNQVKSQFNLFNKVQSWIKSVHKLAILNYDSEDEEEEEEDMDIKSNDTEFEHQLGELYKLTLKARRIFSKAKSDTKTNDENEAHKISVKEQIVNEYKSLRLKQFYQGIQNLQNDYLNIIETCEIFEDVMNQNIQLHFHLLNDKDKMQDFFRKFNIDSQQTNTFLRVIAKVYGLLQQCNHIFKDMRSDLTRLANNEGNSGDSNIDQPNQDISPKSELRSVKHIIQSTHLKSFKKIWLFYNKLLYFYEIHITDDPQKRLCEYYIALRYKDKEDSDTLMYEIGCLTSKWIFEQINNKVQISSMILTSGTLEPFELVEQSLNVPFEKYAAAHVINPQTNLYTKIIKSYGNCTIDMSFKSMQNPKNGKIITESSLNAVIKIITTFIDVSNKTGQNGGILILFKSYSLMEAFQSSSDILTKTIPGLKIFIESRNMKEFKEDLNIYKDKILKKKQNCVFCAVNRGKLSEGIDLVDTLCRVVVIFGIPFPSFEDPYIKCKRLFMKKYQNESRWYEKNTVRVINQGAGRCIRHKDDWGCIFFIDHNFANQYEIYKHISQWIKDGQKVVNQYEEDIDGSWVDQYKQFLITIYDEAQIEKGDLAKIITFTQ